ncbi:phosphomannomutase [Psychrosphaera sp. B3R10]|uniref:phosphomannomutase n=1 Tax=unclassified Psychrosphaera TaxID=2641570 RepID=UPI001C09B355|nr:MULTISPECIES: phosphomannomutase [unclassified Psychrosphaera]MBU2880546.1 phosphomannomutase [Psychrosphaera sp. I2R16]MBU2989133.1 phosphomannomutase [Psychrosphaera sp. B3R10]MDO6717790.1 phosphomannomutase [Psychrosphaera sp. 1_MG-2023]
MYSLNCFKAYDIRGIVPDELNPTLAYEIGRAYATIIDCKTVVIGHDIRLSGPDICQALAKGLIDSGVNVIDIGQCGTEEIYFAVPFFNADGGVCVTASHNPANYNGMKLVGQGSRPISGDSGLSAIKACIANQSFDSLQAPQSKGSYQQEQPRAFYIKKLLTFIDVDQIKPLKIVVNPGNGGAGAVIDAIEPFLPFEFIKVNFAPDGQFPNGVPNPLLVENRAVTRQAIIDHKADLGIAWDGDFDRCFFFDEHGEFIEGYYLVGLLASQLLKTNPNQNIIFDPRLYWNTEVAVKQAGGIGIKSKTGHAFIKERMRTENAIYGGEMSAHHYFRDFYFCDNGNIPWLLITELLCMSGKTLSQLVNQATSQFPCSGEINLTVNNSDKILKALSNKYANGACKVESIDGIGISFDQWRFNVRSSNTEPLLRVNVETRGDRTLLTEKTNELIAFIKLIN